MSSYEILSQEAVAALHRNFTRKLFDMLARQLPDNIRGDRVGEVSLLDAASDLMLAALRRRARTGPKEIGELMRQGPQALVEKKKEIEALPDVFTDRQKAKIAKAAAERKDTPEVSAVFGDQERLYLRIARESASEVEHMITEHLGSRGYTVTDYKGGYATDAAGKQTFRIGKLLAGEPELGLLFTEDPFRAGDPLVVISRNADDIARMSAGRGWTSCMDPTEGKYRMFDQFVHEDIRKGTVIAYLVKADDPDIRNPLGRMLIKPYRALHEGHELFDPEFADDHPLRAAFLKAIDKVKSFPLFPFAGPRERIYVPGMPCGAVTPAFERAVTDFVEENINRGKKGTYEMVWPLYLDGQALEYVRENEKSTPGVFGRMRVEG